MKFYLAIMISALFVNECASQKSAYLKDNIENLHFSRVVIFNKDYKLLDLTLEDSIKRITPGFDEIKRAEKVILDIYNSFPEKGLLSKRRDKYIVQYIGYINSRGEILLLTQFLKYHNTQEAKKYYRNVENEFVIGAGSFFEQNVSRFLINISKSTIELF